MLVEQIFVLALGLASQRKVMCQCFLLLANFFFVYFDIQAGYSSVYVLEVVKMTDEHCILGVYFSPIDSNGYNFFGFSEFLTGLALLVLAWTIVDIRYRFRVRTAPLPLLGTTFWVVAAVGILTLLTDLWRAERWLVPKDSFLTVAIWQALLGGAFFLTFFTWALFAFIRPPKFGRCNARRYCQALYLLILKGSPTELAVIADELGNSAESLIRHASNYDSNNNFKVKNNSVQFYADKILLLISDKKLCRIIVEYSPKTVLDIFSAIKKLHKSKVLIQKFANNIINEAIINKNSFLYQENEYDVRFISTKKPLCWVLFSDYEIVEAIEFILEDNRLDSMQLAAYCEIILIFLKCYLRRINVDSTNLLSRNIMNISNAVGDLYSLSGKDCDKNSDIYRRISVIFNFINLAVKDLEFENVRDRVRSQTQEEYVCVRKSVFDDVAKLIFKVMLHASSVKAPKQTCSLIQYNAVWNRCFPINDLSCDSWRIVKYKVRRLLYTEIVKTTRYAHFSGAKILGFCLNVMELSIINGNNDKRSMTFRKIVHFWTKKNYVWLYRHYPIIAEECLMGNMMYDSSGFRLIFSYSDERFRRETKYVYLELDSEAQEIDT